MRSNGHNSKRGTRNSNGSNASTTTIDGGHGTNVARRNGNGRGEATETESWFEPVDSEKKQEVSDCPGGVCPVPWATHPKGGDPKEEQEQTYQEKTWGTYVEKHQEVFANKERPVLIDNVNHPSHYTDGGIECIEAIEAQLTPEEYRGYLKGNVAKYVWRERHKGGIESLQKAQWYLTQLISQSL